MLPNILGTSIRYTGNPIDQAVQWDDRWFWTLLNRGSCFWRSQICFFPIWPSIGRYCGWNLDVVPLQSDEKRWYEVYQSLLLEFRKDAKWIKKPYDSTICGEWTFIFQLFWYPAWLLIPPFASLRAARLVVQRPWWHSSREIHRSRWGWEWLVKVWGTQKSYGFLGFTLW